MEVNKQTNKLRPGLRIKSIHVFVYCHSFTTESTQNSIFSIEGVTTAIPLSSQPAHQHQLLTAAHHAMVFNIILKKKDKYKCLSLYSISSNNFQILQVFGLLGGASARFTMKHRGNIQQ